MFHQMTLFMDKDTLHQKTVSFSQEPQTPFRDGELDYRPLFEQAGEAFFLVSLNFKLLSLNVQARRLLGYEDGTEITNENLNLEDPDLRRLIIGSRTNTFEHLLFRKDGSSFQVELNSTLIVDKHGSPLMIKLVARDIAGYKQYERMLKRNARAQSVISEVTASLFRSANIEGKLPEVLESLGYAMGVFSCVIFELKNSSLRIKHRWVDSAIPEFEVEKVIKPFMDSISKFPNRVFSIPDVPEKISGASSISMLVVPIQGALGSWGFLGLFDRDDQLSWLPTSFDIVQTTANLLGAAIERMHYEETLRLSERRNRIIVDALPDLLIRVDRSGRIFDYNAGTSHPLYLEPGNSVGRNLQALWGEEITSKLLPQFPGEMLFTHPRSIEKFKLQGIPGDFEARLLPISRIEALVLVRDVTEQARLNQMKSDFINWASHELRTPLTAAILMTDLLKLECTPEEREEYLITLSSELNRQKTLINELLMAGRLENGALRIEIAPMDLNKVLHEAVQSVAPMAKKKKINIDFSITETACIVLGDKSALQQVFINLLSNAIKFSPDNSKVRINAVRNDGMANIAITDSGLGIPKDALPHLFERFYRARNVTTAEIPGSGIGLYIVKSILNELHGDIQVDTEVNKGTTFTVFLKMAAT